MDNKKNEPETLHSYYLRTFETIVADNDLLLQACFHLRYQVYCLENGFIPENSGEIESDEYDAQAAHFLLKHKPSGLFLGTTRVIRGGAPPVVKLCEAHKIQLPSSLADNQIFEVSRFAVSKAFRRRVEDNSHPAIYSRTELLEDQSRIVPSVTLGMISAIYHMMIRENIDHCCAIMEPALGRLLAKMGIHFTSVGPLIEYHGLRQIFIIRVGDVRSSVKEAHPELLPFFD